MYLQDMLCVVLANDCQNDTKRKRTNLVGGTILAVVFKGRQVNQAKPKLTVTGNLSASEHTIVN